MAVRPFLASCVALGLAALGPLLAVGCNETPPEPVKPDTPVRKVEAATTASASASAGGTKRADPDDEPKRPRPPARKHIPAKPTASYRTKEQYCFC